MQQYRYRNSSTGVLVRFSNYQAVTVHQYSYSINRPTLLVQEDSYNNASTGVRVRPGRYGTGIQVQQYRTEWWKYNSGTNRATVQQYECKDCTCLVQTAVRLGSIPTVRSQQYECTTPMSVRYDTAAVLFRAGHLNNWSRQQTEIILCLRTCELASGNHCQHRHRRRRRYRASSWIHHCHPSRVAPRLCFDAQCPLIRGRVSFGFGCESRRFHFFCFRSTSVWRVKEWETAYFCSLAGTSGYRFLLPALTILGPRLTRGQVRCHAVCCHALRICGNSNPAAFPPQKPPDGFD